ncbi:MAG: hypothetical protein PUA56_05915 [Bacillales bacterium]|nr:hypothetical protein [Bacillales bacterium]
MNKLNKDSIKLVKISVLVYLGLFLASSFCFFIDQMWIPLGFLLGGVISILNYFILFLFTYKILKPGSRASLFAGSLYLVRMLLFGLGFFICLFLQYKIGLKIFFWGTCLASYMIFLGLMLLIIDKTKKNEKK